MAKSRTHIQFLLVSVLIRLMAGSGWAATTNEVIWETRRSVLSPLSAPAPGSLATNWPPVLVSATASNWTAYATIDDARFGYSLAGGSDITGDGLVDLIVGAPNLVGFPKPWPRHGAVFIFQGTSNGPSGSISYFFHAPQDNTHLGFALAELGDINRDGLADFAVGAPRYDLPVTDAGACFLFSGVSSLSELRPVLVGGEKKRAWFGQSVAAAGDVNRDGFDDFLVGAPLDSLVSRYSGAAFLFLGGHKVDASKSDWVIRGAISLNRLGDSLAGAGDVNGDGFPDVIVGAPQHDTKLQQTGRTLVFQGSPSGLSSVPVWTADGPGDYAWFGDKVGGRVDLNGDGISEVFVAAPGHNRSFSSWPGEISFYFGSKTGLAHQASIRLSGDQAGSRFGADVALGGDVNGDGLPDLLVGAPFYDSDHTDAGRVCLYLGSTNGFRSRPDWVLDGGKAGARCGLSVAWAGDQNGDGFSDFVVGAPDYPGVTDRGGRVDFFYGSATAFRGVERSVATATIEGYKVSRGAGLKRVARRDGVLMAILLAAMACVGAVVYAGIRRSTTGRDRDARGVLQVERQRLARDLHDDLGARLARISLLTELVRRDAGQSEEGRKNAQILSETAREVLGSMEQILWSVNPVNDTLENLVTFIVQYAGPFFAPTGITFRHDVPPQLPECIIRPETRKNVFLTIKEALNNIVKHSGATEARLDIAFKDSRLTIIIEDNGCGLPQVGQEVPATKDSINQPRPRRGNGLGNMRARIEEIHGQFAIEPRNSGGTCVRIVVNL